MIVIDTSALLAIALKEPGRDAFEAVLAVHPQRLMSAGTLAESLIVSEGKGVGPVVRALIDVLVPEVIVVDEAMARLAFEAFLRFGRGRHPARLNYGDCFAYALAKSRGLPLLFKGNDFSQTDIESVLRAARIPSVPASMDSFRCLRYSAPTQFQSTLPMGNIKAIDFQ